MEEAIYKCESEKCMYPFQQFVYKNYSTNRFYKYEAIQTSRESPVIEIKTSSPFASQEKKEAIEFNNFDYEYPNFDDFLCDDSNVRTLKFELEDLLSSTENSLSDPEILQPSCSNDMIPNDTHLFGFNSSQQENVKLEIDKTLDTSFQTDDTYDIDKLLSDLTPPSPDSQASDVGTNLLDLDELEDALDKISLSPEDIENCQDDFYKKNQQDCLLLDNSTNSLEIKLKSDFNSEMSELIAIERVSLDSLDAILNDTHKVDRKNDTVLRETPAKKKVLASTLLPTLSVTTETNKSDEASPPPKVEDFVFKIPPSPNKLRISPKKQIRHQVHQPTRNFPKKVNNAHTSKVTKSKKKTLSAKSIKTEKDLNKTVLKLFHKKSELKPFQMLKQLSDMKLNAISKSVLQEVTKGAINPSKEVKLPNR